MPLNEKIFLIQNASQTVTGLGVPHNSAGHVQKTPVIQTRRKPSKTLVPGNTVHDIEIPFFLRPVMADSAIR